MTLSTLACSWAVALSWRFWEDLSEESRKAAFAHRMAVLDPRIASSLDSASTFSMISATTNWSKEIMKVICRNTTRKFLQCSFSIELFEILGWAVHIYTHTHSCSVLFFSRFYANDIQKREDEFLVQISKNIWLSIVNLKNIFFIIIKNNKIDK